MIRLMSGCLVLVLTLLSGQTVAQTYTPETVGAFRLPNFAYGVRPKPGVYQDLGQLGTGRGWTIDSAQIGAADIFFGAFYHYLPNGQPTWLVLQSTITQASPSEYKADGVPAYVRGTMYNGVNGPCIDCPLTQNTVVTAPIGERTLNIIGGRKLQFLQLNGQAPMNPQLVRDAQPGSASQRLVDSGAVWALSMRHSILGQVETRSAGWVRFGKRDPIRYWTYIGYTGTSIHDGIGGFLPSTMPAWLDIASKNGLPQYELVCATQDMPQLGLCIGVGGAEPFGRSDSDLDTWIIDPTTDRLHHFAHTTQGVSFLRDNAVVQRAAVLIDAGPDADGNDRFVYRNYSRNVDGFDIELQFTKVPLPLVQAIIPGYVPTSN